MIKPTPNKPPKLSLIMGDKSPASKLYLAKNMPPKASAIAPIQVIQFCSNPVRSFSNTEAINKGIAGFAFIDLTLGVTTVFTGSFLR